MPKVKYTGGSHYRELGAADFKKFGVEGQKKHTFARNEETEVTDAVAKVLVDRLPNEFVVVEDEKKSTATPGANQSKQGA